MKEHDSRPCWISSIAPKNASGELADLYRQVGAVNNEIHNLYQTFSLQPKPVVSADQHYLDILRNKCNESEPWFLELLASQVAIIADCDYALANHGSSFLNLLGDDILGKQMLRSIRQDNYDNNPIFTTKQAALLKYGARICRYPETLREQDIIALRAAGVSDTEILEAVQTTACFAYWVRFINALGVQMNDGTADRYTHVKY